MPETSPQISSWTVEDALPNGIACLLAQSSTKIDEHTVETNQEIFGVNVCYSRFQCTVNDAIIYRYTITGRKWELRRQIVITDTTTIQDMLKNPEWYGTGDYDKWMIDATLIKLHGV